MKETDVFVILHVFKTSDVWWKERLSRKYKENAMSYARKCVCLRGRAGWREQGDDSSRTGLESWPQQCSLRVSLGDVHSGIGPEVTRTWVLTWLCLGCGVPVPQVRG